MSNTPESPDTDTTAQTPEENATETPTRPPRSRSRRAFTIETPPPEPLTTPQARGHQTRHARAEEKTELLRQLNAGPDAPINKCTIQQLRFTLNLIQNGGNGTQAARDAGVPEPSAASYASETRRNPKVQAIIRQRIAETLAAPAATEREVARTVAAMMRFDPADLDGCVKDNGDFDWQLARERGISKFIKKVRTRFLIGGTREVTVEWHDQKDASKLVGRWLGMDIDAQRNPADIARERQETDRNRIWAERQITQLCETHGRTRDEMLAYLRQRGGHLAEILLGAELKGGELMPDEIPDDDLASDVAF